MNDTVVTAEIQVAFALIVQSEEDYPVDFELAWAWLGYSRKDNALRMLKENFVEGDDYLLLTNEEQDKKHGGHNKQIISLTVDCFKMLGMASQTAQGNSIRRYYIQLEKAHGRMKTELLAKWEKLAIGTDTLINHFMDVTHEGWDIHDAAKKMFNKRHMELLAQEANEHFQRIVATPSLYIKKPEYMNLPKDSLDNRQSA